MSAHAPVPEGEVATEAAAPEAVAERDGAVLVITINRPGQKNAMTRAAGEIIAAAVDELDSDPSLSVAVLTGADGTFCAGMGRPRTPGSVGHGAWKASRLK
jgi:enoyl-CoA hydratase